MMWDILVFNFQTLTVLHPHSLETGHVHSQNTDVKNSNSLKKKRKYFLSCQRGNSNDRPDTKVVYMLKLYTRIVEFNFLHESNSPNLITAKNGFLLIKSNGKISFFSSSSGGTASWSLAAWEFHISCCVWLWSPCTPHAHLQSDSQTLRCFFISYWHYQPFIF